MPATIKKMSVHRARLKQIRARVTRDWTESQEEHRELTAVFRVVYKAAMGEPLLNWEDFVFEEVLRTGKPVLLKGEDPDKSIATYRSLRLVVLCQKLNGTPETALSNPALEWPSICDGPIRADSTFRTQASQLKLFGFFLQHFQISPPI